MVQSNFKFFSAHMLALQSIVQLSEKNNHLNDHDNRQQSVRSDYVIRHALNQVTCHQSCKSMLYPVQTLIHDDVEASR